MRISTFYSEANEFTENEVSGRKMVSTSEMFTSFEKLPDIGKNKSNLLETQWMEYDPFQCDS